MVLSKLLRAGEGRKVKNLSKVVERVNACEDDVASLSDEDLRARTETLKARVADGETLDEILPEAFATVRDAAKRVLGQRAYDVQVMGGIALHRGDIAEMKTGEGKTLTSTMPVYLNALSGKGVHVVTVNPYLAARDADWMGRVYHFLGLEVGLVRSQQPRDDKRTAYAADITYGTNNEFGFDFLRDHMVVRAGDKMQRGHAFAMVDEVDSILVDEARTPLIISGPADQATEWYTVFAKRVVPRLKRDEHYEVDEGKRTVAVSEEGVTRVEELLGVDNLYESVNTPLIHHLQNGIRAKELYRRDDEYIVADGEVHIVDEHTGRTLYGRRYSEGLHQAIEAKEGARIKEENQTLATITLQNYYRQYDKICGMTGTAKTEEGEFAHTYSMGVVEVPTNRPVQRADQADRIYSTEQAKLDAIVADITARHDAGQPILVGTVSVEKSEKLSGILKRQGIRHEVLNAKNHFREADIIAQAGRVGAVTVATNMAGRGVDITLGGNAEAVAASEAKRAVAEAEAGEGGDEQQLATGADPELYAKTYDEALAGLRPAYEAEGAKVREVGGLYVLGTERHDSRRIDNQLRGRSGRQGDPGESRFLLSLEDPLMKWFGRNIDTIRNRIHLPDDVPIEAKMVTKAVARAQSQVEARNFEARKNVLKYDDVMNKQRSVVYQQRDLVLEGSDEQVGEFAEDFVEQAVRSAVGQFAPEGVYPEEWDLDELWSVLGAMYPLSLDQAEIAAQLDDLTSADLAEQLLDDAMARYEEREAEVGAEVMRSVERRVILSVVDRVWREHLYEMDHLRDGIGLRAVGQRDPLVEYQREAYAAFTGMLERIKEEATGYFFNLPVQKAEPTPSTNEGAAATSRAAGGGAAAGSAGKPKVTRPALREGVAAQPQPQRLSYTSSSSSATAPTRSGGGSASYTVGGGQGSASGPGPQAQAQAAARTATREPVRNTEKVGRNDPCPCGSGEKYKRCHGA